MPYDDGSMRSIYHVREYNIRRLSLVNTFPFSTAPAEAALKALQAGHLSIA